MNMQTHSTEPTNRLYANPAKNALTESTAKHFQRSQRDTDDDLAAAKARNLKRDRHKVIMIAMWQRMADYLGPQWERAYSTVLTSEGHEGSAFHAWMCGLEIYDEADIGAAITRCQKWDGFDPPTFAQFTQLVEAARKNRQPPPAPVSQRIEHKPDATVIEYLARFGGTPVAKRELDRMRRILAGEEVETKEQSMHKLNLTGRWA